MMQPEYRVWDKVHGEMYDWETIKSEFVMRDFESDDYVWMQWTGLLDKNGRKVFAGDEIKRYKESIVLGKKTKVEYYQKVVYSQKHAQFLLQDKNGSQEHASWATTGEVIGNIHEAKHLSD